jgi:glycosyltransferase involved in cell wall biosynthesis
MRIAILGPVSWRVPPRHYGGWELITSLLTEGLVARGHSVTLFATADSVTSARLISVCPRPLSEDPSLPAQAYELLHHVKPFEMADEFDIIHNHAGSKPVALSRLVNTPLVTTLHGSAAEPDSRLIYSHFKNGYYVSISEAERRLAPDLNYLATVYNGIEVERFSFNPSPGSYLVVIGRLSPDKGIHHAIEVAERCGVPLVIAGIVPPENQQYFSEVIRPRLRGLIDFVGPADHSLKDELLSGAMACLHLVTYEEAFGLTQVEAMACGTPVIGFRRGAVPEIVCHGVTGFVVDTVDDAVAAVGQVPRIDRAQCRRWVEERFSARQMVEGYEQVYRSVLGTT